MGEKPECLWDSIQTTDLPGAHTMLSTGPVEMTRVMSKAGYGRRELTCMTAMLGSPADQTGPVSAGLDGSSLTPALWDL